MRPKVRAVVDKRQMTITDVIVKAQIERDALRRTAESRVALLEKIADLAAYNTDYSRAGFSANCSLWLTPEDYKREMRQLLHRLEILDAS